LLEGETWSRKSRPLPNALNLREAADYEAEFSQSGAKAVIASAEKFIGKAIAILDVEKP
jgi:hypothetical protein